MFRFFKKIFLFIFICILLTFPSAYAIQNKYTNVFNNVYAIIFRFLPTFSLSSLNIFKKYKFRKKNTKPVENLNNPKDIASDPKDYGNNIQPYQTHDNQDKITEKVENLNNKTTLNNTVIALPVLFLLYAYLKKADNTLLSILEKSLINNTKKEKKYEKKRKFHLPFDSKLKIDLNESYLKLLKYEYEKKQKMLEIIKEFLLYVDPNLKIDLNTKLFPLLLTQYPKNDLIGYFVGHKRNKYYDDSPYGMYKKIIEISKIEETSWRKIEKCISQGANPNLQIGPQKTPILNLAIGYKQENLVRQLLKYRADPNRRDSKKKTSLYILLNSLSDDGNFDKTEMNIFENLLQHNVDCNEYRHFLATTCGGHPLQFRSISNDVIKRLIEYSADVNPTDSFHVNYPLGIAIATKDISFVDFLIKKGANVNRKDNPPLHQSIWQKRKNITKLLIEKGADVNNADGKTPLGIAIESAWGLGRHKDNETIQKLCHAGALLTNKYYLETELHLMAAKPLCFSKETFETVLLYAHPSFDNKLAYDEQYENLKENIFLLKFLLFRQNKFPQEVQAIIFSEILSKDTVAHNKVRSKLSYNSLRNRLHKTDKQYNTIVQVKNHVIDLEKILEEKNKKGKTSYQVLPKYEESLLCYINKIDQLLNRNKLYRNYNDFNEKFPTILTSNPENFICKIYKTYEQKNSPS